MIILGVDPGTATTGYGLIRASRKKIKIIEAGIIQTNKGLSDSYRLNLVYTQINKIFNKFKPNILAIEKLFFFKNLKTAIPVAQSKGVLLLAAQRKKIPIYEFTPLEVKMTIVGYGRAQKIQVRKPLHLQVNLEYLFPPY